MPSGVSVRLARPHVSFTGVLAALAASLLVLLLVMLAIAASPAGAVITEVPSGPTVGLQPPNVETPLDGPTAEEIKKTPFVNSTGNPVVHGADIYVIYWDPRDLFLESWQRIINKYFQEVGTNSGALTDALAVDTQYTDKTNEGALNQFTFRGAYTDTANYPTGECTDTGELKSKTCLTDAQVNSQLQTFIAANKLVKGMHTIFFVVTAPGVTVCLEAAGTRCSDFSGVGTASYKSAFCSYHAAVNPGGKPEGDGNAVLYAVLPYVASGFSEFPLGSVDCQDGGYNASSKPFLEEPEEAKEETEAEEKEFEKATKKQKEEKERQKLFEGPHLQAPNQHLENHEDFQGAGGFADVIVNQAGEELQNTITDPLLNAWHGGEGKEVTDECRNFFASSNIGEDGQGEAETGELGGNVEATEEGYGTLYNQALGSHNYYLNNTFNHSSELLRGPRCLASVALQPRFTAPNPVNTGDIVGFDGMETEIWLHAGTVYSGSVPSTTYSVDTWNFGDGTPTVTGYAPGAPVCEAPWLSPCAGSVFHTYQYGGVYNVTLTVKDVGGHVETFTAPITVVGPPPPSPEGGGGSGGGSGSGSTAGGSTSGGGSGPGSGSGAGASIANPEANAAVVSRTLRSVKKSGVVIAYSVNEQVAGHVEVLIGRALAKRLHLTGPAAAGLPAGSPPEIVLAKAFVVTTKAGRSTVKVLVGKHNATRLAHQRKVSFMLRLFVRNAAPKPATATLLSAFTLTH